MIHCGILLTLFYFVKLENKLDVLPKVDLFQNYTENHFELMSGIIVLKVECFLYFIKPLH